MKRSAINGNDTSKNNKPIKTCKRKSRPRLFAGLAPFTMVALWGMGLNVGVLLDNTFFGTFFGGTDLIVE